LLTVTVGTVQPFGGQAGLPRGALAGPGLDDLTDDDCSDLFGRDAGAVERGADGVRSQIAGGEGCEAAAEAAEGGTGAAKDDRDVGVLVQTGFCGRRRRHVFVLCLGVGPWPPACCGSHHID
jgi:hypothetical protein